jgi:opacity protein-like surface antigen
MLKLARHAALAALAAGAVFPAAAADIMEPPVVEAAPVTPIAYEEPADYGGWYIRGDVDWHKSSFREAEYITYGPPPGTNTLRGEVDGAFSLGAGIGYQINNHLRVDLTADHWFKSDFKGSTSGFCGPAPCTTSDTSSVSTWLLLANAYAELGTWHGFTPYVGAGIGGAHVKWDTLTNTPPGAEHPGSKSWRFAYAVMAGASYCLTNRLKLDAGYRFSHIEGGRMFEQVGLEPGPGFDKGFNTHEVRAGLRYQFGGRSNCEEPVEVAYEAPPAIEPVYK